MTQLWIESNTYSDRAAVASSMLAAVKYSYTNRDSFAVVAKQSGFIEPRDAV